MPRWLVIATALASGAGCRDPKLAQLEQVKQAVCACRSVACADAAMAELPPVAPDPTPRTQQLARDIVDCVARLAAAPPPAGVPSEPPAAP